MREFRVMIVEDEPDTASAYAAHIRRLDGFTVTMTATSLGQALAFTAAGLRGDAPEASTGSFPFDVVLLDMNLPDGHGLDLLQQLRTRGFHGGVLAVTAATDLPVIRRALALGVVQYLVKPFGAEELEQRLTVFRTTAAQVAGAGRLQDQDAVDAVFRVGTQRRREDLPKGLTRDTLRRVEALLRKAPSAMSAGEVGERVGVSRVTARRYLEHLEGVGAAARTARHGGRGRPEQQYRWVDPA